MYSEHSVNANYQTSSMPHAVYANSSYSRTAAHQPTSTTFSSYPSDAHVIGSRQFFVPGGAFIPPQAPSTPNQIQLPPMKYEMKYSPTSHGTQSMPPFDGTLLDRPRTDDSLPCAICGDKGTGKHYGAHSCDGCKGFFRRTIRKNREYRCRQNNDCYIDKDHRNTCRSCRFRNCLLAGMKRDSVQHERDQISSKPVLLGMKRTVTDSGRDDFETQMAIDVVSHSLASQELSGRKSGSFKSSRSTSRSSPPYDASDRPMSPPTMTAHKTNNIDRLDFIQCLIDAEEVCRQIKRHTVITNTAQARQDRPIINGKRVANVADITDSMRQQLLLMVEWAKTLPPFNALAMPDQITLLRNYSAQHLLICLAYRSWGDGKAPNDMVFLTNDTVITRSTKDVHDVNNVTSRVLDELVAPMNELEITEAEYVALKGITFFNPRTQGLGETISVNQTRDRIQSALIQLVIGDNHADPSYAMRVNNLMLILPPLQAISQGLLEDINLATVFGMARLDSLLEELLPMKNVDAYHEIKNIRPDNPGYEVQSPPEILVTKI